MTLTRINPTGESFQVSRFQVTGVSDKKELTARGY